ncbi:putative ATP-dependent RNA helicase DDX28 [Daphnia magna]|uniref:Putative ATP-dependent RNA helicase DDX28 n=1 Tax=Daphnia magna TaxID=35525 RepID=A0A0P5T140_9CRUS|nr:putative ATP-dependent RNA helicase DDX28 [Daphnia magna]
MERFISTKALSLFQSNRFVSTVSKPVITIPLKWQNKLTRDLNQKQEQDRLKASLQGNTKVCIVSCKNTKLNHYSGQSYGKFDKVPLASRSWGHREANGDYFAINSQGPNPSILRNEDCEFSLLDLSEPLTKNLTAMGCIKPTLIQKLATKAVLRGENSLIAAETGSGKTISYLAPIIQKIIDYKSSNSVANEPLDQSLNAPLALVITPGRELCEQISNVGQSLMANLPIKSQCITGGRLKRDMLNADYQEVDILFATFGAISKMTTNRIFRLDQLKHLVLDEADTLLDDSFNEKLTYFLRKLPLQSTRHNEIIQGVQTIMVSATIPRSAEEILSQVIPYGSFTKLTTQNLHRLQPHVPQKFIRLSHLDKPTRLLELVKKDVSRKLPVIVFSNRSDRCDWVSMFLNENGVSCVNLNGNMPEHLRNGRFEEFHSGRQLVLSCTDVVSRGLDTTSVHQVINYDVPTNISDYIHRCGRIGRVGHQVTGIITTFVCHPTEADLVQKIEYAARRTHNDELPNVNANIKRLITNQMLKKHEQRVLLN